MNHCSNKALQSFKTSACPRAEGTRALSTRGSVWLNQLSPSLRLKWRGTDRLHTGCHGFRCCPPSRGVEMPGCCGTSLGNAASSGWKLTQKPHPRPPKHASDPLVPLRSAPSLRGPAYGREKYSLWLKCSWSVGQIWPRKAKKTFVWTVVLQAEVARIGCSCRTGPWSIKMEPGGIPALCLQGPCFNRIIRQQAERRSSWHHQNKKVWRGCYPPENVLYPSFGLEQLALLSSTVLHILYPSRTPKFTCPGRLPSCFREPLSLVLMSAGLTLTSSEVIYQLLVAVWLSLNYMPHVSPLFYLSAPRNGYCWTLETFVKAMTADLLQRAAEFL